MEDKEKYIAITRNNWQQNKENSIASPAYYEKCEQTLAELAARHIRDDMTILDLGCADGRFTALVASYAKNAIGYEFSATLLARACQQFCSEKISFGPIDLEKRDWILPACQLTMCMGVLIYIHEDDQMHYILSSIRDSLAEGKGHILITRDSLSKGRTFSHMTQDKYYSIYRSYGDFYSLFDSEGFACTDEIKLFEDKYVINAFRIWELKRS